MPGFWPNKAITKKQIASDKNKGVEPLSTLLIQHRFNFEDVQILLIWEHADVAALVENGTETRVIRSSYKTVYARTNFYL